MRMRITLLSILTAFIGLALVGCGGSWRALNDDKDELFPVQLFNNDGSFAEDFVYPDQAYSGQTVTFEAMVPLKQPHGKVEFRWDFQDWATEVANEGSAHDQGTASVISQAEGAETAEPETEEQTSAIIGAQVSVNLIKNLRGIPDRKTGYLTVIVGNDIKQEIKPYKFQFDLIPITSDPAGPNPDSLLVSLTWPMESGRGGTMEVENVPQDGTNWQYSWDFGGGAVESGGSGSGTSSKSKPDITYINRTAAVQSHTGKVTIWEDKFPETKTELSFTYSVQPLQVFSVTRKQVKLDTEPTIVKLSTHLQTGVATQWSWDVSELGIFRPDSDSSSESPEIEITVDPGEAKSKPVNCILLVKNEHAQAELKFTFTVFKADAEAPAPLLIAGVEPVFGGCGEQIQLAVAVEPSDEEGLIYEWDLKDGAVPCFSWSKSPSVKLINTTDEMQSYSCSVTATDKLDPSRTATEAFSLTVKPLSVAAVDPLTVSAGTRTFKAVLSSGKASEWLWDLRTLVASDKPGVFKTDVATIEVDVTAAPGEYSCKLFVSNEYKATEFAFKVVVI